MAIVGAACALATPPADAAYGPIPFDLDGSFGSGGTSRAELPVEPTPRRLYVAADGAIYSLTTDAAAGELTHYVSKRAATGALDVAYGAGGTIAFADPAAGEQVYLGLCVDPASGALYLTGATQGEDAFIVRRLLADGSPDNGWGTAGLLSVPLAGGPPPYAQGCTVQPDGKLVVVGSWSVIDADARGLVNRAFIARLTSAGVLDGSFGDAGVHAVAPKLDDFSQLHYALTHVEVRGLSGEIYAAGQATNPRHLGRDLFATRVTASGQPVLPYGHSGAAFFVLPPASEQVSGIRVNPGGYLVAALLHHTLAADGFSVTAVRLTPQGERDLGYGCVGIKSGPVALESVEPFAAAFDGAGAALFLGRESGTETFESVVRMSGLPELAEGGSSGEEIAHGCLPFQGRHDGGSSLPATLVVLGLLAALRRLGRC